jgi:hypothetical protein
MFAGLLGHLSSAKSRQSDCSAASLKKKELEQKIEQRLQQEKQSSLEVAAQYKKEIEIKKQTQIKKERMECIDMLQKLSSSHQMNLSNFIPTKYAPILYYVPGQFNDTTRKLLSESKIFHSEQSSHCLVADIDPILETWNENEQIEQNKLKLNSSSSHVRSSPSRRSRSRSRGRSNSNSNSPIHEPSTDTLQSCIVEEQTEPTEQTEPIEQDKTE